MSDLVDLVRSEGRILVAGAGVSGAGIVAILQDLGATNITVVDDNTERALSLGVSAGTTAEAAADMTGVCLIAASPGWRPDSPLFAAADAAGVPVVGEIALARAGDADGVWGSPRTWIVITGTNGKTTTTGMLAAILGPRGRAVGNIGVPLHAALTAPDRVEILATELSSFQLHWSPTVHPDTGALLNLAEDHIDWHGSFENYALDKANALTGEVAVYGADDPLVAETVGKLREAGTLAPQVVGFTAGEPVPGQVGIKDGYVVDRAFSDEPGGLKITATDNLQPPGIRGQLNGTAAIALARSVGLAPDEISKGLSTFTVEAHRGQIVHRSEGVVWFDDSKATNPHAADAAMTGLSDFVWVGGGQLKGADIRPLAAKHAHSMTAAVLLGVDARLIADALAEVHPDLPVTVITETDPRQSMIEATAAAAAAATSTVLLAPAAASLDMFTGMSQRGDLFAEGAVLATMAENHPEATERR